MSPNTQLWGCRDSEEFTKYPWKLSMAILTLFNLPTFPITRTKLEMDQYQKL